jgi:hypothetical protein
LPTQLTAAGVPDPVLAGFQSATSTGSFDFNQLLNVGGDLGASILAAIPAAGKAFVEPYIGNIVAGIYSAFSMAVAQTFWLGVFGSVVAVVAAIAIKEIPLRTTAGAPVATVKQDGLGSPASPATRTGAPTDKPGTVPATE